MSKDIVQEQYENWVYPSPVDDLSTSPIREQLDPSCWATHFAYWPRCADWHRKEILIAGCGANQAASIAFHNRQCRVTGVDVSASSLAHEAYLKDKHGLDNLELIQMPLEELATLGRRFDLILCVGVLHHLKSPETGLRALRECLKTDGSMGLMVYGKYARTGRKATWFSSPGRRARSSSITRIGTLEPTIRCTNGRWAFRSARSGRRSSCSPARSGLTA